MGTETGSSGTKDIGRRIVAFRKRRSLTQSALAEAVGLDVTMLCRYERGHVQARVETLARIAEALGVTLDALV